MIMIIMIIILLQGETFLQVTRLLQGYIENEVKHFQIWNILIAESDHSESFSQHPGFPTKSHQKAPWYLWEFPAWAKASFQVDMSPTQNCKSECSGEHQHHHHHLIFSSIIALVDMMILHLEKNTTEKFQIPLSAEGCFCQKNCR